MRPLVGLGLPGIIGVPPHAGFPCAARGKKVRRRHLLHACRCGAVVSCVSATLMGAFGPCGTILGVSSRRPSAFAELCLVCSVLTSPVLMGVVGKAGLKSCPPSLP